MVTKSSLKFIKSLKLKKYRQQEKYYVIEGRKGIEEALKSGLPIEQVIGTESFGIWLEKNALLTDVSFESVNQRTLEGISSFQSNNTGVAVAPIIDHELQEEGPRIILDGVRDPGNLGTIIRSMDWFGFKTLICSPDCADCYNPKTLAATMGSFTRLVPHYMNLESYLSDRPELPVYGMLLGGKPMEGMPLPEEAAYLLGSESHGIREPLLPFVKNKIAITQFGGAESLNVAMATTILLYAMRATPV
ncbi:MAG: RNA methyltransferase [Cytophagales bacterium]|nr:RNA methyltransferase [Cytophagales bacterium]